MSKVIAIPGDVALQGTYLNDIRFSPDGKIGYITDSGTRGAIIVVDLEAGTAFRALDGVPAKQIEKDVTVKIDGKPLRRPDGRQPAFYGRRGRDFERRHDTVLPSADRDQTLLHQY